ncbi:MAG TPA: ABC transporter permease [Lacunisphaera sp.]|jgi:predicted permease|nr:ABC transporter permease [Lacunisphaera sp.]
MLTALRQVFRQLAKAPGFTLAAVLILALGIGVNTAIFSVVEAALLRPLPFPHPDRLVRLYEAYDQSDSRANTLSLSEQTVQQWRDNGKDIFTGIGAATGASLTLGGESGESARYLPAAQVTSNFFDVLGISPVLGRNFTAAEDRPNGPRVVIISHDLWQRQFGGRPEILGQTIRLDGIARTVVGVMPAKFRHPYRAEAWIPLGVAFDTRVNPYHYLYAAARLQPGVTLAAADAAIRRMCANISRAAPNPANPVRAYVRTLREGFVADLEPKLLAIYGAALCAFLVAAANFAGLLMSRAVEREADTAIRAALGASSRRLVRESLLQAFVLAALGTAVGLLLAAWITPALVALSPEGSDATGSAMREFDSTVRLNLPVFGCAAFALLLVGLGFGFLPACRAARADLRSAMGNGSRSATLDRGTRRVLGSLVVAEIAAALVLLVGAGLLTEHFRTLVNQPWGFATENRLTFNLSTARLFPTAESRVRFLDRALAELRALPGVRSATATVPQPLHAARELVGNNPEGSTPPEPRGYELAYLRASAPGYFGTMGQALLRGREFTADDTAASPPVCIINESMAKRYWPGQDAVGKRVKWGRLDSNRPWLTVVGVAADTRVVADPNDGSINGTLCLPAAQAIAATLDLNEFTFVLETSVPPLSLEKAARVAIARTDPRVAIYDVATVAELARESWVTERFAATLVSLFGALGLVLAAVGLYGLLSLQVARRRREFGVRLALGSTATGLFRLVAAQGLRLLAVGIVGGGSLAWIAVRFARSAWPELPSASLSLFAGAAFVLAAAVVFACWLPARRAARVDPMVALRAE